ncbi:unnamed protein product, partial [Brassica rapa subsp. trilocularis]
MICNIGKDLGTILDHELTKTTARVKVLVDGLKSLTKEAIIEYDSGEESIIYLEYEKLENHCSLCNSLSHLKKDCTMALRADHEGDVKQKENMTTQRRGTYSEEDGSWGRSMNRVEQHKSAFHERVDRHGNNFGARAATKQTRVPPPTRILENSRGESHNWRSKASERVPEPQGYSSPPYTMRRDIGRETNFQRKNSFPQKGLKTSQNYRIGVGLSKDLVLQELQEVTKQYLSCADPVEAAARRQRVLAGDAEGLMEKTADSILAASAEQRRPLSPWERGVRSESPPGIDFDLAMQPSDVEVTPPPPPALRSIDPNGIESVVLTRRPNKSPEGIYSGRFKSIVVSPEVRIEEGNTVSKEVLEVADDEDTLLNFQNKTKKKRADKVRIRSPRLSPNILRGVSLKKRKFSQIQHSPSNGRKCLSGAPSKNHLSSGVTRRGDVVENGSILLTKNPAIQLIPAMSRKKQDSRGSP